MKKKILTSLLLASLFTSTAFAQETNDTQSVQQQTTSDSKNIETDNVSDLNNSISSDAKPVQNQDGRTAEQILEDVMEAYINENNLRDKYAYVGSAVGEASFNQTNSNYTDGVQIAFEKSLIKAQAEYISFISANTKVDKSLSINSNQGTGANELNTDSDKPKAGTQAAIDAKTMALSEAELDAKLKANGVNPNDIASPDEKRKLLLNQQMTIQSLTTGFGNLSGLLPIKTFVVEKDGNAAVGVVVIYSDKIKGMFEDIKHGNEPVIKGKGGKPTADLYKDKSGEDMMGDFGIRVGFDENNQPYILSFGQGSYTGAKIQGVSASSYAYKQAEIQARANIVTLVAGQMSTKEALTLSENIASTLVKNTQTDQLRRDDTTDIEKALSTYYQTHAQLDLIGLKTVKKWRYTLPSTSNTVYGVVIRWNPEQVKTANAIKNFDYDKYRREHAQTSDSGKTSLNGQVIIRQSDDNEYLNQF
ncbi:DUF6844 domain-containing protein [Pseudofrancisella aestuarii]|uniref:DUF6844 domain-containing protein n=1 Tax=Pseudofrancisella aestuarii TaxID=2670347 RepID=A0ABV9TCT7_9GAMM|nr:hypothetical protein [Pseudofrancisella aestuarii]